jgi:hypothetical protein
LHDRSSTSYRIRNYNRWLCFGSDSATEPQVPPEALLAARETINEMLRQAGPAIRRAMAAHYSRFIVWGEAAGSGPQSRSSS